MSPLLFYVYMDGVVREEYASVLGKGLELLSLNGGRFEIKKFLLVVVVVVGQTVGSISSKTLAYDCLYTLELCTVSMIATS